MTVTLKRISHDPELYFAGEVLTDDRYCLFVRVQDMHQYDASLPDRWHVDVLVTQPSQAESLIKGYTAHVDPLKDAIELFYEGVGIGYLYELAGTNKQKLLQVIRKELPAIISNFDNLMGKPTNHIGTTNEQLCRGQL